MNKQELIREIERVKEALRKTTSAKLESDYKKHLKRLQKRLAYEVRA